MVLVLHVRRIEFIDAFMEYTDSCYDVLRCCRSDCPAAA
jgi:hypothetical protein